MGPSFDLEPDDVVRQAFDRERFIETIDVLQVAAPGGTPSPDAVWRTLPAEVQHALIETHLCLFVIDAVEVAVNCPIRIAGPVPRRTRAIGPRRARRQDGERGHATIQARSMSHE